AKKNAPCIIFIDEIDAVGRQRGSGLGGSHDEREQTLNQILTEMDGFEPNLGVIVIAATNRPDVLDPALLRPGRFDRRVTLDLPDINEREAILKVHAKNKPLTKDVDLRTVAQRTVGFSGADLMNLLNEAAIRAGRTNAKEVTNLDVLTSIEKVMLGPERKSYVMNAEEKKVTAYHEAGHALVAKMLPDADPVHKVSIISRGSAGGYTMKLPNEDRRLHRRKQFLADLAMSLGGYVAEQETFGDITTGASSDLKHCNQLARQLVVRYGMSELGPRTFGEREEMIFLGKEMHETRNYSEKTAQDIDEQVTKLVHGAMETARAIIREKKTHLDKIANTLLEKETIEKDAFEALFA
ncbi:ATP-dependent zinc metalloprotease FtsH, partial [bacterium]|nr:ATP-dependent zinc metalloprotease FtsH [bacterium]